MHYFGIPDWTDPCGTMCLTREPELRRGRRTGYACIKPWLSALVAPDGYSITMTKHFERVEDALLGRGGQAMNKPHKGTPRQSLGAGAATSRNPRFSTTGPAQLRPRSKPCGGVGIGRSRLQQWRPVVTNLWDRQPGETAKGYAAFLHYRDLPAIDRSVAAARERQERDHKGTLRQWNGWSMRNGWVNRAAEHDSNLASRRRERMMKELERAQDDAVTLVRAALAKVAERIKVMDPEELAAGQIPAALKTLVELEFKALGQEDKLALKHEGKIEVEASADAAWLMDYLRSLPERTNDQSEE